LQFKHFGLLVFASTFPLRKAMGVGLGVGQTSDFVGRTLRGEHVSHALLFGPDGTNSVSHFAHGFGGYVA
jgi:hypothetical protein